MCHFNVRPRDTTEEEFEEEEPEDAEPAFADMEEAEDVRIVTDGGDE